eukprot:4284194-Prymnesium_polylepis.1
MAQQVYHSTARVGANHIVVRTRSHEAGQACEPGHVTLSVILLNACLDEIGQPLIDCPAPLGLHGQATAKTSHARKRGERKCEVGSKGCKAESAKSAVGVACHEPLSSVRSPKP